jgi:hypothetical protein
MWATQVLPTSMWAPISGGTGLYVAVFEEKEDVKNDKI